MLMKFFRQAFGGLHISLEGILVSPQQELEKWQEVPFAQLVISGTLRQKVLNPWEELVDRFKLSEVPLV